jgi:hypothetical protein
LALGNSGDHSQSARPDLIAEAYASKDEFGAAIAKGEKAI